MLATGLNVLNDGLPTHESGYVLDLILGIPGSATSFTLPQFIAGSDHKMVVAQSSFRVTADLSFGLNRVSWSHSESWREGLNHIDQLLRHSGEVIDSVFIEIQTCSDVPKKRKRALLEAAAWIREAIYCVLGHCISAVKVSAASSTCRAAAYCNEASPDSRIPHMTAHDLPAQRRAIASKFASLCRIDPGQAQSFLSRFLDRQKMFQISLRQEDTGEVMSRHSTLSALMDDLDCRGNNSFPADEEAQREMQAAVAIILHAGAPPECSGLAGLPSPPPANTSLNDRPYSFDELRVVLKKLSSNKASVRCPIAAVKAESITGQELTLKLCNLGRLCGMAPSLWCMRHVTPIRKCGPLLVTSSAHLRPISKSSDMAAVQDSLWLLRSKPFIEKFTGDLQFGGKFDCVALVIALTLHLHVHNFQGLLSYLLFADVKWAFNAANKSLMLLTCYWAGIVKNEWCLLHDFFAQDHAVVVLTGFLSNMMCFAAGIPQGRRLSMHAFTASMQALRSSRRSLVQAYALP